MDFLKQQLYILFLIFSFGNIIATDLNSDLGSSATPDQLVTIDGNVNKGGKIECIIEMPRQLVPEHSKSRCTFMLKRCKLKRYESQKQKCFDDAANICNMKTLPEKCLVNPTYVKSDAHLVPTDDNVNKTTRLEAEHQTSECTLLMKRCKEKKTELTKQQCLNDAKIICNVKTPPEDIFVNAMDVNSDTHGIDTSVATDHLVPIDDNVNISSNKESTTKSTLQLAAKRQEIYCTHAMNSCKLKATEDKKQKCFDNANKICNIKTPSEDTLATATEVFSDTQSTNSSSGYTVASAHSVPIDENVTTNVRNITVTTGSEEDSRKNATFNGMLTKIKIYSHGTYEAMPIDGNLNIDTKVETLDRVSLSKNSSSGHTVASAHLVPIDENVTTNVRNITVTTGSEEDSRKNVTFNGMLTKIKIYSHGTYEAMPIDGNLNIDTKVETLDRVSLSKNSSSGHTVASAHSVPMDENVTTNVRNITVTTGSEEDSRKNATFNGMLTKIKIYSHGTYEAMPIDSNLNIDTKVETLNRVSLSKNSSSGHTVASAHLVPIDENVTTNVRNITVTTESEEDSRKNATFNGMLTKIKIYSHGTYEAMPIDGNLNIDTKVETLDRVSLSKNSSSGHTVASAHSVPMDENVTTNVRNITVTTGSEEDSRKNATFNGMLTKIKIYSHGTYEAMPIDSNLNIDTKVETLDRVTLSKNSSSGHTVASAHLVPIDENITTNVRNITVTTGSEEDSRKNATFNGMLTKIKIYSHGTYEAMPIDGNLNIDTKVETLGRVSLSKNSSSGHTVASAHSVPIDNNATTSVRNITATTGSKKVSGMNMIHSFTGNKINLYSGGTYDSMETLDLVHLRLSEYLNKMKNKVETNPITTEHRKMCEFILKTCDSGGIELQKQICLLDPNYFSNMSSLHGDTLVNKHDIEWSAQTLPTTFYRKSCRYPRKSCNPNEPIDEECSQNVIFDSILKTPPEDILVKGDNVNPDKLDKETSVPYTLPNAQWNPHDNVDDIDEIEPEFFGNTFAKPEGRDVESPAAHTLTSTQSAPIKNSEDEVPKDDNATKRGKRSIGDTEIKKKSPKYERMEARRNMCLSKTVEIEKQKCLYGAKIQCISTILAEECSEIFADLNGMQPVNGDSRAVNESVHIHDNVTIGTKLETVDRRSFGRSLDLNGMKAFNTTDSVSVNDNVTISSGVVTAVAGSEGNATNVKPEVDDLEPYDDPTNNYHLTLDGVYHWQLLGDFYNFHNIQYIRKNITVHFTTVYSYESFMNYIRKQSITDSKGIFKIMNVTVTNNTYNDKLELTRMFQNMIKDKMEVTDTKEEEHIFRIPPESRLSLFQLVFNGGGIMRSSHYLAFTNTLTSEIKYEPQPIENAKIECKFKQIRFLKNIKVVFTEQSTDKPEEMIMGSRDADPNINSGFVDNAFHNEKNFAWLVPVWTTSIEEAATSIVFVRQFQPSSKYEELFYPPADQHIRTDYRYLIMRKDPTSSYRVTNVGLVRSFRSIWPASYKWNACTSNINIERQLPSSVEIYNEIGLYTQYKSPPLKHICSKIRHKERLSLCWNVVLLNEDDLVYVP